MSQAKGLASRRCRDADTFRSRSTILRRLFRLSEASCGPHESVAAPTQSDWLSWSFIEQWAGNEILVLSGRGREAQLEWQQVDVIHGFVLDTREKDLLLIELWLHWHLTDLDLHQGANVYSRLLRREQEILLWQPAETSQ
jgi:hypothetical protein